MHRACRATIVAAMTTVMLAAPSPALAWGAAAHRYIMRRALDLLPAELQAFFVDHRDEVVMRVNDPDLWRVAGFDDDANHFMNLGMAALGPYPFKALPRDLDAAMEKFGEAQLKRVGLLPWRTAEEFGNLRRAFEGIAHGAPFASGNAVLFAAVAAHYIQDAHQPFHASNNYDGQLTNQQGIHARFETALFERFESKLTIAPAAASPMTRPRDATFDILLASYQLVPRVLQADTAAIAAQDTYDDGYFERFFTNARPVLEQRLGGAITATASLIWGAWEQAGRPALKADPLRAPEKVRRPESVLDDRR
jgi:hypothetical protein